MSVCHKNILNTFLRNTDYILVKKNYFIFFGCVFMKDSFFKLARLILIIVNFK